MGQIQNLLKVVRNPVRIVPILGAKGILKNVPDKLYLKLMYKAMMGKKLDLKNPKTFNEKLQWLKIYDRNLLYTKLVDKYEVRRYIGEKIGYEYLIPLIGVWDKFEDIEFEKLPEQFVLKCTHDSGSVIVCKDKKVLNIDTTKNIINNSLNRNYYPYGREWPYKNIKPRIIGEQLIKTEEGKLPNDYKFHCFNGDPDNVMVCTDRDSGKPRFFFFDRQWKLLKYNISGINAPENFTLAKPQKIDEMFWIAEKLSSGLPFVRVDLYCEGEKIYFGELTFFPQSGFDPNLLESTDILFGDKIELDQITSRDSQSNII